MTIAEQLEHASQLHESGRLAEAEAIYRQILAVDPENPRVLQLIGVMLYQVGRSADAMRVIGHALRLSPDSADFHSNLGVILADAGQHQQAIVSFERAISLSPDDPSYHWSLAINLLAVGEFKRGWEEFEWRLREPARRLNRGFPQRQWDGSDLAGKTILLHAEGGFGDAIQFVRYLPRVAGRGGKIILECQPELVRLFASLPGISEIFPQGAALPHFDLQIPLQGLARLFGTTLNNIPANVPYLAAPAEGVNFWKNRLASEPGRKIGLAWAGSSSSNGKRSRTIDIFAPLASVPDVRFFSLQKGPEARQPIPPGLHLTDYSDQLNDFADMAGFIEALDFVISIDTSVAHLAGALARPVWTVLPFAADFRWLRDRTDSPWYPTMRLYRQAKDESWVSTVSRIAASL